MSLKYEPASEPADPAALAEPRAPPPGRHLLRQGASQRQFFIDNLLVRINFIIVMIRWTGLAPWEFEFPFPSQGRINESLRAAYGLPRLCLHAARVAFAHPITGERLELHEPLPSDLTAFLSACPLAPSAAVIDGMIFSGEGMAPLLSGEAVAPVP